MRTKPDSFGLAVLRSLIVGKMGRGDRRRSMFLAPRARALRRGAAALRARPGDPREGARPTDVATTLNNLAGLYYAQGRYAKAQPLYERALAISETALAPTTPRPPRPAARLQPRLPADRTSVRAVAEALEGESLFERCAFWTDACSDVHLCPLHDMRKRIRPIVRDEFTALTIAELSRRKTRGGVVDVVLAAAPSTTKASPKVSDSCSTAKRKAASRRKAPAGRSS
jgi:hypothetical protein